MWIILKAAGEGRARGRIGACSLDDEGGGEVGNGGSDEHCDAKTMLWIGNIMTCSFEYDFEEVTARMCVGYAGC